MQCAASGLLVGNSSRKCLGWNVPPPSFSSPPPARFIYESAKLAHTLIWHREPFKWGTAILFV